MIAIGNGIAKSMLLLAAGYGIWQGPGQPPTLDQVLPKLGWDVAKRGPLLVVDSAHTFTVTDVQGLAGFNRKVAALGTLSAVVPTDMVVVNDDLPEPNLYDGMDADAKVLYLMATLTPDQLRLASEKGISPNDLTGQPRAALESLVGHEFVYSSLPGARSDNPGETVPEDKLGAILLKINRELNFEVSSGNNPNGVMRLDPHTMGGGPGLPRLWHLKEKGGNRFGFVPRSLKSNSLKKADIDYASQRLSTTINLASKSTVAELLRQASAASGLTLVADPRVSSLSVEAYGASARTGDVLRALALAVTGTFRKVGSTYVLTSDLIGLGERQTRFWVWENRSAEKQMDKSAEFIKQIFAAKALDSIGYDKSDPNRPSDALASTLATGEANGGAQKVSISQLTEAEAATLTGIANRMPERQKFDTSQVGVFSKLAYSFVLPDGRQLNPDISSLGPIRDWKDMLSGSASTAPPIGQFSLGKPAGPRALMLRLENADAVKTIAAAAAGYGFTELWLQTTNKRALDAAAQSGLKVRFVTEPWKSATIIADPDRDVIGGLEGLEWLPSDRPSPKIGLFSPLDPQLPASWATLKSLASGPGVIGTVIADTQPPGYERERPAKHNFYGTASEKLEFGYSVAEREAFLKADGVDPIDICNDVHLTYDIAQPFFPDGIHTRPEERDAGDPMPKLRVDWIKFRADLNEKIAQKLLETFRIVDRPLLVRLRRRSYESDPQQVFFTEWTPERAMTDLLQPGANDVMAMPIPNDDLPGWAPDRTLPSIPLFPEKTTPLVADLRSVAPRDVVSTLALWFVKPK